MKQPTQFETLTRPKSPNTYLVAPEGLCQTATVDQQSPGYPLAPADLFSKARETFSEQKRVACVGEDVDTLALQFEAKTPLMGFVDDIDVRILENGAGASHIAIYSRSRVGHSDLGANRKRVQSWLDALQKAVSTP